MLGTGPPLELFPNAPTWLAVAPLLCLRACVFVGFGLILHYFVRCSLFVVLVRWRCYPFFCCRYTSRKSFAADVLRLSTTRLRICHKDQKAPKHVPWHSQKHVNVGSTTITKHAWSPKKHQPSTRSYTKTEKEKRNWTNTYPQSTAKRDFVERGTATSCHQH